MQQDKSLFYYGRPFHLLLDPLLKAHHRVVVDLIPAGATVLDAASGTGDVSLALARKGCRVVGVDISQRMLDFARSRVHGEPVTFLHGDVSDLSSFADRQFDYGVLCQVLHELPRETELAAVAALARVAKTVVLVDHAAPPPKNPFGPGVKIVEATVGHDHYRHFVAFEAAGGLTGIIRDAGLSDRITRTELFRKDSGQLVLLKS